MEQGSHNIHRHVCFIRRDAMLPDLIRVECGGRLFIRYYVCRLETEINDKNGHRSRSYFAHTQQNISVNYNYIWNSASTS